jgi:hypothetical protein
MRRALLAILAFALSMAVSAQDIGASLVVSPFAPQGDGTAAAVTEILKVGIARGSLVRTLDAGEGEAAARAAAAADFSLSGNVVSGEGGVVVSYTLVETATGKTIAARALRTRRDSLYVSVTMLAAELENSIVASSFGSTLDKVEKLVSLGRFDEADARLDAYASRHPADAGIATLRRSIRYGQASAWLSQAKSEYAMAGDSNLKAASAREAAAAALSLYPDTEEGRAGRNTCADFLRERIMPLLERQALDRRSAVEREARAALSAGRPGAAAAAIDEYLSSAGEGRDSPALAALRERASRLEARALADKALKATRAGEEAAAASLALDALRKASSDAYVERAYLSVTDAAHSAEDAERLRALVGEPLFVLAATRVSSLSVSALLLSMGEGDLDMPLSGAMPGLSLSFRSYRALGGPLSFFWSAAASAVSGGGTVATQGYRGSLDEAVAQLSGGVGLAYIRAPAMAGLSLHAGPAYVRYAASYEGSPRGLSGGGFAVGLGARAMGEYYAFKHGALSLFAGPDLFACPGYGFVSGFVLGFGLSLAWR